MAGIDAAEGPFWGLRGSVRPHPARDGWPFWVISPTRVAALAALAIFLLGAPVAHALCNTPGDPDCVDLQASFRGTIDFFATGASFTYDDDDDDRPDGLLEEASVTIAARRVPPRAKLVQAYLYFGGSLFADNDGNDEPDTEVELEVPGAVGFATVSGDQVYRSGAIPGFPDVTLYTVRADITEVINQAGGNMTGTFRVRGFAADIFNADLEHTAANASFSIVLIFEEERLPPRNIVLFDGMQEVLGSTVTLSLSGFIVSQVPSGTLTLYAQEGDCNPGPESCANGNNLSGLERVNVIGADPSRQLALTDDLNPPNDIFNRTINTTDPPQTNVPGTDIDAFDITPVLRGGDESVTVEITTPFPSAPFSGELVGLVYVVVGIDVFAPELREDSRIEVRTARGEKLDAYYPGDPLRVTYALSNTGNIPGTGVALDTDLPANTTAFQVVAEPEGSTVTVDPTGGAHGRGRVSLTDLRVRHGEVNDLVLLVETECPLPNGGSFSISGDVGTPLEGGSPFTMTASVALLARDRCGPRFFLYGGGGCSSTAPPLSGGSSGWWLLLVLVPGFIRFGKWACVRLAWLALLGAGCSGDGVVLADREPPVPLGFECPDAPGMVVIPSLRGRPPFCIDQYEAGLALEGRGNAVQSGDGDGSTTAAATSQRFAQPARGVTWFQARAACANAGKRLCTADEWVTACRGDADSTFPYGDVYEPTTCNGFDARRDDAVETGAMIQGVEGDDGVLVAAGCASRNGVYDLSGNVWEWNATPYFEAARRGLAGGSFRSNLTGLRCVTEDNHATPDELNDAFGFRCCRDFSAL